MKAYKRAKSLRTSQIAVTAALMTVPTLAISSTPALAQRGTKTESKSETQPDSKRTFILPHVLEKSGSIHRVVGIDNEGRCILSGEDDKLFYLDAKTGDQKFVSSKHTIKMTSSSTKQGKFKGGSHKILGVDASGHTILQNSRNEKFYLDPETGDMITVR